jgi:hypothetical protein
MYEEKKPNLFEQWWFRLGAWIVLFGIISEVSPTPVIPGLFVIGSLVFFGLYLAYPKKRKKNYYYRGI